LTSVGDIATPAGVGLTSTSTVGTTTGRSGGAGVQAFTTQIRTTPTPLILPGLFTAINVESARPQNRVFMSYGYYDEFQTTNPATGVGLIKGFNLNAYYVGAEMAFLDNRASVYVRVPFLQATDNAIGAPLDGLGDISAGFKYALLSCNETGSTLSLGLTVAAPTARDLRATTTTFLNDQNTGRAFTTGPVGSPPNFTIPLNQTVTANPTYIQPYVAGVIGLDRLFISSYAGLVYSTDDHFSNFINADLAIGYQIYRCEHSEGWITSITPTFSAQLLLPIDHQGTPQGNLSQTGTVVGPAGGGQLTDTTTPQGFSVGSPYQVFLTEGVSIGLGCRSVLSAGIVTPVTGPKAYSIGAVVGFNFFF
jgi:hypothetical protein